MPRKVSTGDGKRKADAAAAATQAPAKKTCPHRTPQTPFESGDKETTYIVDKMVGTRWNQGSREYLVRWKGYAASADTWEPMENLVGCAQQIREYEKLREKEDIEVKAAVLAKRQEAKKTAPVDNNQSVALLTPLANASQYLEGKNYTTSNLVIPSMYGCIELLHPNAAVRHPWDGKLLQPKDLRPEVTEGRQVLYDDMVRRWKTEISTELRRFYLIATICDPRQQGLTFPCVSQEERLETHEWFEAEYDSLWNTSAPEEPSVPALAPAASASLPVPALAPAASASASLGSFVDFMASVAHLQAPVPAQVSRVKSEAHRYLELPAAPMNTDPLEWWAANEINFPALSVMARQYLGVPATSASAERLFSLAGRAFDDLRQCMKEEMLEILMWARINKEKRQRD